MSRKLDAREPSRHLGSLIVFMLVLAVAACSGKVGSPEGAIKKMVKAYGGSQNIGRLQSFVGKGFIKELSQEVAMSNAFDIYLKGRLYKHKVYRAPQGKLTDVIILCYDGRESREWVKGQGLRHVPVMELAMEKYRFPAVLEWLQGTSLKGEIVPAAKGDREVRLRYRDGDIVATIDLDGKTWLLSGIELASTTDTSFSYGERYTHYRDVDGVPFPGGFKATYKGTPYFEFFLASIEPGAVLPDSLFTVTSEDTASVTAPPKVEPAEPPK